MNKRATFGTAAALAAAALLVAIGQASAAHHHGFGHHHRGLFGGVISTYPLGGYVEPVSTASLPAQAIPMAVPLPSLTCQHSQQTVTVPAEDGGERKITITRC